MKTTTKSTIVLAMAAMILSPAMAWAEGTTNVCKPISGKRDTVVCQWPLDAASNPLPDTSACQRHIRVPTSSDDDCGNGDFKECMEGLGFQCADTRIENDNDDNENDRDH